MALSKCADAEELEGGRRKWRGEMKETKEWEGGGGFMHKKRGRVVLGAIFWVVVVNGCYTVT